MPLNLLRLTAVPLPSDVEELVQNWHACSKEEDLQVTIMKFIVRDISESFDWILFLPLPSDTGCQGVQQALQTQSA